jgi:hypothetical protein
VLSVLIPAIHTRRSSVDLITLLTSTTRPEIEVLVLMDNMKRSVGRKRQGLLDLAQGEYVAFVDDDDDFRVGYQDSILAAARAHPDVITFDSVCTINDGPWVKIYHRLGNPIEQYNPKGFTRPPWHIHPIRREIAQRYRFPDINNGEDAVWLKQVWPDLKTEVRASEEPLYYYRYNSATTEASK